MNTELHADTRFDFHSPVHLHFGRGLLDDLGQFCKDARSILLVTGRNSARENGFTDRILSALKDRRVSVFAEVEPNPSIETVEQGATVAREIHADLVIGLGGGSAMDAAKIIAVLATNEGGMATVFSLPDCENTPAGNIAVPTTCGTGSEANRYAIITDRQLHDKTTVQNRRTYPALGILDPSVLDNIPVDLLTGTAFDAFAHAFEGYTSLRAQPFADMLALEAMGLVLRLLPAAADGDREAKAELLYAATVAGIVINHTGTTLVHGMGYYLTLKHGIPHGAANAMLLPILFEHLDNLGMEKMRAVYSLLPGREKSLSGFEKYLAGLGVDTSLSGNGILPAEFDQFADYVLGRKNTARTPGTLDKRGLISFFESRG
jgi:alcohol dehydrogenase class IV